MLPRFVPLLLVAACASKGGEGARGQGEKEAVVPPAPAGAAWRTAQGASWKDVLEDLAAADVAFVSGEDEARLSVLRYLFDRGRLHAIGLEEFPRTVQAALDDYSFQRIDGNELLMRCGAISLWIQPVLEFARERRLPLIGLGTEGTILDAMAAPGPDGTPRGLAGLSEEQRRSLPAIPLRKPGGDPDADWPDRFMFDVETEVAADVVVRWYRDAAPEGAQIVILAPERSIAPREEMPERLFARSGKTYRTLVVRPGTAETADPASFLRSFADYIWFVPPASPDSK